MSSEKQILIADIDRLEAQMDILGEPPELEKKLIELQQQLDRLDD